MKKPVNIPPAAEAEAGGATEASAPSLVIETTEASTSGESEAAPTLDPPFASSSGDQDSFGAGVWHNSKRVNGLFSTNQTRNSWMSITGIGWVKLASNIDSANEALTVLATAAKVKNSPVNYYLDGGQATQIYVW